MNEKIDLSKYEGHTEGPWESEEWDEGKILGPISERHRNNHPVVAVVGDGWWGDMMPECNANLRLMTDAPLLLAEVKQLTEFRDKVLAAFVEMTQNERSLTYLLNELGYLNHYSRADYLEGLHPHALGLYELKDEWMDKAQQYLESEEE
jgi:hypothetical protein|tara:strand:- start:27 stop:473 length:447 start_codon:yes stop_codon:yes gene_type:complete